VTETMKVCTKCGQEFPATREFFYRNALGRNGLNPQCKQCKAAYASSEEARERNRLRTLENPQKNRDRAHKWALEHPEENRLRANRWYKANREKALARDRQRKIDHPEETRARARRTALLHPETVAASSRNRKARARNAEGSHTGADVIEQYNRQKGKCYYCGKQVGKDYQVDHVIPLVLGGSNYPSNLVIACPQCNRAKSAKHPTEFCGRML
jgi:5-methylcytosine-specific restriction endonuclease McrA